MAEQKKTRRQYPASLKVQILDEVATEGAVATHVAEQHGINPQIIYNWRKNEKSIRKAAKREPSEDTAPTNGLSNGLSNGVHKSVPQKADVEPKKGLQIVGLTPLIRELVIIELNKELGPLVERMMGEVVGKELEKAFVRKRGQ